MKAAKFGMPASEAHRMVERHFTVMTERKLLEEMHFAHAVQELPKLKAALDAIKVA